ncbi:MAG TPA: hypothetical protein VL295_02320, partial [Gemmatimonadales bacterium]|nr:hypothetical protein [Gemmatimonadales bacterium]
TDLLVAASGRSDLYRGPRPVASRLVALYPNSARREPPPSAPEGAELTGLTAVERKALAAAVAAATELFGPLTDSAGWTRRLPTWWRDSIATPAFPVAVARAIAPAKASIAPSMLAEWQLRPRIDRGRARPDAVVDLHWWFWGAALLLFLLERAVATRWRDPE